MSRAAIFNLCTDFRSKQGRRRECKGILMESSRGEFPGCLGSMSDLAVALFAARPSQSGKSRENSIDTSGVRLWSVWRRLI